MEDLFPHRAHIGSTSYGLDADHWDHRNDNTPAPELVVTEKPEPLLVWHPDGIRYRLIEDGNTVTFGFHPTSAK